MAPLAVRDEVLRAGPEIPGVTAIRDAFAAGWLTVQPVTDRAAVETFTAELALVPNGAALLRDAAARRSLTAAA